MFMEKYDVKFKKKFGQNFLKDNNIVRKIVATGGIISKSLVIEVGPGGAIMTRELAGVADHVLAYEIDNDLSDEVSKFLSGFKMIYSNLIGVLNKNEVKEIVAYGVEFDPNIHQAVLMEHDETKPSGVVLEVLQKGYMYKDKCIRPAMVKVNE
mgnify:CR=1 FL=1